MPQWCGPVVRPSVIAHHLLTAAYYAAGIAQVRQHPPQRRRSPAQGPCAYHQRVAPYREPCCAPLTRRRTADWRSHNPEKDFVATRHIYRNREGATFNVRYNPSHQWYYLGGQTPDEVALIECFDSDESKARLTPQKQPIEVRV